MKEKLHIEFGLEALEIGKLNGYDNSNYLIKTSGKKYIFKTYPEKEDIYDLIEAENKTLLHLLRVNGETFPTPIPFKDTSYIKVLTIDGKNKICRMLSFLEGTFWGDVTPSKTSYKSLGTFLAKLDLSLQKFTNYTIKSRTWEWDIASLELNASYIDDIANAKDRNLVRYFFQQYKEIVQPISQTLRKQVIHNDANEWNLLVKDDQVSGIIDFGDIAYSYLINELAVAITYACYDKEDPIPWACIILESYHRILPLEEKEVSVLYYLIAARLCISVCNSAHAKKADSTNTYASVSEVNAWKMLYRLLKINPIYAENTFRKAVGFAIEKPISINEAVHQRNQHISAIVSTSYHRPIYMVRSAFQYMYDAYGNTFLDAYNNIPHVGHSHPQVVEAGQRQMAKLNTNTRYLYDQLPEYAARLVAKFPESLSKVFFINSGSAASDLAIRLAKAHTGFEKIMVMESGYHGNTQTSIDISDYKFNNPKGQGQKEYIIKTPIPDTYKGKYTAEHKNAGQIYGQEAVAQIQNTTDPVAAFITEPVVGCAGQIPLAEGYLDVVYKAIRAQGGVCISDEVQTGFGRLGDHYWGYEAHQVIPDIVIMGKPIANGHPMGAVICTQEIAASFDKGVEFFSSFGGNPVSCAIATAVLDVIEEENLQENAKIIGDYYKSCLQKLKKTYSCIGDVRGSGLFLGIEIVHDNTLKPNTALADRIKNELRNQHILISTDGPYNNVLKTKPALCFTKENVDMVIRALDGVLRKH
ncbi:aminotransferase class III-fold pyridoxal phosphate-dependent enzyme [uncultured Dokdonia sp.]|uniref:aminotransferase class III-fold pyridoxal phosphate-dependent enzyme n=1 Tax=uncultured Dokdonia sp. TaxID=575653 RepID=UPI00260E908F|nr:aminotransferase class III-fold pyridoxal phosphate-dependent enzyme [uncultured Dokdonia sp.]